MAIEYSAITYDPDYLSIEYIDGVYHGAARASFYSREGQAVMGGYSPIGTLVYSRSATEAEILYLKQYHPEVFNRKSPRRGYPAG